MANIFEGIHVVPPDAEWLQRLEENGALFTQPVSKCGYSGCCSARYLKLKQKLKDILSAVGYAVILPHIEEDIVNLVKKGEFVSAEGAIRMTGAPIQCHSNSAEIWYKNQESVALMTGYALSKEGGLWRQHSWCLLVADPVTGEECDEVIIETTEPRILYYGFRMSPEEADLFFEENC